MGASDQPKEQSINSIIHQYQFKTEIDHQGDGELKQNENFFYTKSESQYSKFSKFNDSHHYNISVKCKNEAIIPTYE